MHAPTRVALFALGALLMPQFAAAQDGEVEFVVYNRTSIAVTVFANWEGRSRGVRLGELRGRRDNTYTVDLRGSEVWLGVDPLADAGRGGRLITGADRYEDEYIPVRAGDKIEWEIRLLDPLDIFYRRLDSEGEAGPAGTAALNLDDLPHREPEVSRYTAISAMAIQQAQELEDPDEQAAAYREALDDILNGLSREDDNPEAYLHLAIVQTGLGNYLAADSAFDIAEAYYPEYATQEEGGTSAYRLNGWIQAYTQAVGLMEAQDAQGAVDLFQVANTLYDKRPEAYLNAGGQMVALGDLEGSIEAWRSAIAIIESPDGVPGDDETRRSWDEQFWPMAQSNLGQVLEMAGRAEEAIPVYEALLERDPDNAQARSSLALALAASGQGGGALTIFDEILARDDAAALDYFNAGVSLYSADELDKAVIGFEKALERAPMYKDALQNLAQTLDILQNYEALIPYTTRLLELDPYNEYGYSMHVRAMVQVGMQTEAVAALEIMQALPFATDNIQFQPTASGGTVVGQAINKTMDSGSEITLRFTFYDGAGNPLGTEDVDVTISDVDVAHGFQVSFSSDTQLLGYSYELGN